MLRIHNQVAHYLCFKFKQLADMQSPFDAKHLGCTMSVSSYLSTVVSQCFGRNLFVVSLTPLSSQAPTCIKDKTCEYCVGTMRTNYCGWLVPNVYTSQHKCLVNIEVRVSRCRFMRVRCTFLLYMCIHRG